MRSLRERGWSSSGDFHVQLIFDGREQAEYTGYPGSSSQLSYLPAQTAAELLEAANGKLTDAPLDPAARSLFVRAFTAARPHFADDFHWWVREIYVRASGTAGTRELLPTLAQLRQGTGTDASLVRTHEQAGRALERLGVQSTP